MTKRLICLAAVAATLAGCAASSGTAPKVLPPASARAAGADGNATTASTTGEAAAVEAAVRHYFAVANQALATGNVRPLEALSLPGCGCRELSQYVLSTYSKGQRPVGADFRVEAVQLHDFQTDSAGALVTLSINAYHDVERDGAVGATYPAHRGQEDLTLIRRGNSWLVAAAVSLPQ